MAEITKWVKKIWKNRTTEFPTRRTLMKEDGSSEIVTVTRNEGTVSEEGDAFDADTMNNLEERIDAGFAELNGNLNYIPRCIVTISSQKTLEIPYNDYIGITFIVMQKDLGFQLFNHPYTTGGALVNVVNSYITMVKDNDNEKYILTNTHSWAMAYLYFIRY